jgi:hypothetical protein
LSSERAIRVVAKNIDDPINTENSGAAVGQVGIRCLHGGGGNPEIPNYRRPYVDIHDVLDELIAQHSLSGSRQPTSPGITSITASWTTICTATMCRRLDCRSRVLGSCLRAWLGQDCASASASTRSSLAEYG